MTDPNHDRQPSPSEPPEDPTLPLFPLPEPPDLATKGPGRRGLSEDERAKVLHLQAQGLGSRRIAQALSVSRHAIRKLLAAEGLLEPGQSKRADGASHVSPSSPAARASKLDPFRELVAERVRQGLTATRILRELREQCYRGGRSILTEYVRGLRGPLAPRARKVTRRFETEPGRETQVDWSSYRVEIAGRQQLVHALGMVLGYSRYAYLRFFAHQRQAALQEGLGSGFEHFQGLAAETLFDNMASVVLGRVGADRTPIWNPELLAFATHMGTVPKLCRVAHPDRKGEVEAFLGYAERDFVRGRTAASLADLNVQARRWLDEVANRRVHGTTGRVPAEAWEEERPFLIPLPESRYPGACEVEYRQVAEDCTVSIRGTRYSVPSRLAHRQVRVRLYAERFEVLGREGEVAFEREYATGADARRLQLEPSHYDELPRRRDRRGGKTKALEAEVLVRWPMLQGFVEGLQRSVKSLLHVHLRRLLRLAERYGDEAVATAATKAHGAGRHSCNAVERILERDHPVVREEPLPLPQQASAQVLALLEDPEEDASLDGFGYLDAAPGQDPEEGEHGRQ